MEELVSFLRELRQVPAMAAGICSVLESLREIFMDQIGGKGKDRRWTLNEILEICSSRGLLKGNPPGEL